MKRPFHLLWLVVVCLLSVRPIYAAENQAAIPYKTLDSMFQPINQIDPAKLEVMVFVSSTNKAVHRSDIRLTIQSTVKGPIPLALGTNGQILSFPHEKELVRENPSVVVNQPKGSIVLWVTMQLPPPDGLTFRYDRLGDGVTEVNKAIRAQAGMILSLVAPKARGVIFFFPKTNAGKVMVEIETAAGNQAYRADKNGRLKLKLDQALLAENPIVKMAGKPDFIAPDIEGL